MKKKAVLDLIIGTLLIFVASVYVCFLTGNFLIFMLPGILFFLEAVAIIEKIGFFGGD